MFDFAARKQGLHIAVSFDEATADNSVVITMTNNEGETRVVTGTIVLDD